MSWSHRTVAQEWQIVGLSSRHTQQEIARIVGVGPWTVLNVQRKYHVVLRFGRCHSSKRRYAYNEHVWGAILEELYCKRRLSLEEIGRRCGLHPDTVSRRLKELGFPIRKPWESNLGSKRPGYAATVRAKLPSCMAGCGRGVRGEGSYCAMCRRKKGFREAE